jgi:beta-lactam-binding protein with PASTA domain/serine/threonine protein kinase
VQTATEDPLVGGVLEGRYLLTARIARGGMSTVYRAVDTRLDRQVAVKVMSAGLSNDPAFGDRFAREARTAARLSHVNAVSVFDQGGDAGHVFLVMELVEGRTVRDLLRENGPLPPALALSVIEPVLSALASAHRAGLVHRDIKPENILISNDGVVKVADFGLARAVEFDDVAARTGVMMGTVAYCPPEQISRGPCDQRSDVYSAGVVLFELLTGQAPFAGDSPMAIAYQHVHGRVPAPSSRVATVPPELDAIVVRSTSSDPASRPADASEFLSELRQIRSTLGLPVVPIPSPRRRATVPRVSSDSTARMNGKTGDMAAALFSTDRVGVDAGRHDTAVAGPPHRSATPEGYGDGARRAFAGRPGAPPRRPPTRTRTARQRRRRSTIIITLVILLLGLLAGVGAWWMVSGRYSTVPNVSGESRSVARLALRRAGFGQTGVTSEYSENVAKDSVIRTVPPSGSELTRNRSVTLVVSSGKERFTIPDVHDQSQQDAQAALAKFPFQISVVQQTSDSVPNGNVIGTDPSAGSQVKRGQTVHLLVSSGPAIIEVPDVTGQSQGDATQTLTNASFKVAVRQEISDDVDPGTVIDQQPAGNDHAAKFSTVTITVAQGSLITIPSVGGDVGAAKTELQSLGLKVKVHKRFGGLLGRLVDMSPSPGTQVHRGDTVNLDVI